MGLPCLDFSSREFVFVRNIIILARTSLHAKYLAVILNNCANYF